MNSTCPIPNRRDFLKAAGIAAAGFLPRLQPTLYSAERKKLPVAAVVTVYRKMSHTDVIVGKILEGWLQDGGPGPDLELASLYVDQIPKDDMSRPMAKRFGFRLSDTISDAITLGTDKVQVAGVLSIGEHGDYPYTPDTQQHMYPRRRFFEQIVSTFERAGKVVPVFNDKHLAYRWDDAKYMYDTARAKKIPMLAGSSVPLGWRVPPLELDRNDELESALTIGWSGLEIYGIHALEAHQAMIERRRGGESGLVSVQALQGEEIRRAAEQGRWQFDLFEAALKTLPGKIPANFDWTTRDETAVYLCEHRDGLKSTIVMAGNLTSDFAFAAKIKRKTQPAATWIRLQEGPPFGHFAQLLRAIEETIQTNREAYPLERTLLTTGTLDRLMHSLAEKGRRFETPELAIAYQPTDWPYANHVQTKLRLPELPQP